MSTSCYLSSRQHPLTNAQTACFAEHAQVCVFSSHRGVGFNWQLPPRLKWQCKFYARCASWQTTCGLSTKAGVTSLFTKLFIGGTTCLSATLPHPLSRDHTMNALIVAAGATFCLFSRHLSRSGPIWGVTLFWVTFRLHVYSARQLLPFCTYYKRHMQRSHARFQVGLCTVDTGASQQIDGVLGHCALCSEPSDRNASIIKLQLMASSTSSSSAIWAVSWLEPHRICWYCSIQCRETWGESTSQQVSFKSVGYF